MDEMSRRYVKDADLENNRGTMITDLNQTTGRKDKSWGSSYSPVPNRIGNGNIPHQYHGSSVADLTIQWSRR